MSGRQKKGKRKHNTIKQQVRPGYGKTRDGLIVKLRQPQVGKPQLNASDAARKIQEDITSIPLVRRNEHQKLRVLWVSQASPLATGFSTYTKNVLTILHETDKYQIAQFGSYMSQNDNRVRDIPWKFYGAMPDIVGIDQKTGRPLYNQQEQQLFRSDNLNQFGKWKFNDVLLDFQPDVVCSIRDWWMDAYTEGSEFRKNFIWIWMPTVDGHPQKNEWLDVYSRLDYCFTYSQYAKQVLQKQSDGLIKVQKVASPGAELDVMRPLDKGECKKRYGLDPKLKVVGTVMRNQPRKLFLRLIDAWKMLYKMNQAEWSRSVLHLHTGMPDVGFDIPLHLHRTGMINSVTFTWMCDNCGHVFFDHWRADDDFKVDCKKCGQHTARTPNTNKGVDRQTLAEIYNSFDLYVQTSICQGWGMPINEAKACGVPAIATDWTAMSEQVKPGTGCQPIHVETTYTEAQTSQQRALFDRKKCAKKILRYITMSPLEYQKCSQLARKDVLQRYTYEVAASQWSEVLDSTQIRDRLYTWDKPPRWLGVGCENFCDIPQGLDDLSFVLFLYENILEHKVEDVEAEEGVKTWLSALAQGKSRYAIFNYFRGVADEHNIKESRRVREQVPVGSENIDDWIDGILIG